MTPIFSGKLRHSRVYVNRVHFHPLLPQFSAENIGPIVRMSFLGTKSMGNFKKFYAPDSAVNRAREQSCGVCKKFLTEILRSCD
jgi:hypothetical protein